MGVAPLTNRQRNAVADLVRGGMIEAVRSGGDDRRARSFLANADAAYDDLQRVRTNLVRHDLAYAVLHDVGEAMMAAYGYRTVPGQKGQHASVARFLTAVFDTPPPSEAALRVDDVRRHRNDRYYKASSPSEAEARLAVADAAILLSAAQERLQGAGDA